MGLSRDLTARQLAGHSDNTGTAEVVDRVGVRVLPDGRMSRARCGALPGLFGKDLGDVGAVQEGAPQRAHGLEVLVLYRRSR
jgi:hypothetical protein